MLKQTESKKIKIAFFHLAFLYSGGGEKLALKQVSLLRNNGYHVDLFAPLLSNEICFPDIIQKIKPHEIIPGFSKVFINKPELGVILTCLIFPFIAYKYRKYDLIIGANQPGPIFGLILKVLFKKKYIIYLAQPTRIVYPRPIDKVHGLKLKNEMPLMRLFFNIFRPFFYWIDLKSVSFADYFLCNGGYMQDILSQIYSKTPVNCPSGASCYASQPLKKSTSQNNSSFAFHSQHIPKPYMLISNRHFPHKKFEYALEILDRLEEKIPLVIVGKETEYTVQLQSLVKYYQLGNFVHFLGYVTEEELKVIYKNCGIYLYTAPEEDFGMGVIEAMGHGKPVIAWNNAGPSKIITHNKDGILVDLDKTEEAVKYVKKCIKNDAFTQQISRNAINTVRNQYSWDSHLAIFHHAIKQIVISPKNEHVISRRGILFSSLKIT